MLHHHRHLLRRHSHRSISFLIRHNTFSPNRKVTSNNIRRMNRLEHPFCRLSRPQLHHHLIRHRRLLHHHHFPRLHRPLTESMYRQRLQTSKIRNLIPVLVAVVLLLHRHHLRLRHHFHPIRCSLITKSQSQREVLFPHHHRLRCHLTFQAAHRRYQQQQQQHEQKHQVRTHQFLHRTMHLIRDKIFSTR